MKSATTSHCHSKNNGRTCARPALVVVFVGRVLRHFAGGTWQNMHVPHMCTCNRDSTPYHRHSSHQHAQWLGHEQWLHATKVSDLPKRRTSSCCATQLLPTPTSPNTHTQSHRLRPSHHNHLSLQQRAPHHWPGPPARLDCITQELRQLLATTSIAASRSNRTNCTERTLLLLLLAVGIEG